jgi:MFS family permease
MVRTMSVNRWAAFASLSLLFFVVSAGAFSSMGVVLPSMVSELHWNWTQAGVGYTLLGVACGLASLIPAVLIRRLGVRANIAIGSSFLVAGFAAMAVTHSVWLYLVATILIGVAFSLISTVPGTHVLTGLFKNRSTVLGAYFTIGALGGVAGPLLYVVVNAATHGWRGYWVVFVVAAVLAGAFGIVSTPGKAQDVPHEDQPPEQVGPAEMIEGLRDWTVRRALAAPQFYVIVGAYTMYLLVNTTAHGFAVEHLAERGIDAKASATMLSVEALIGAVVSVIGGVIGEKVSAKTLLIVALAALTIGMWALAEARGYAMMIVYAIGVGVGFGLTFLGSTMLLYNYFGKRPNLELYSIMCLMSTAAALGPAFGGWARDTLGSFEQVFLVCTGATFAMLVATVFMTPPRPAAIRGAQQLESQV